MIIIAGFNIFLKNSLLIFLVSNKHIKNAVAIYIVTVPWYHNIPRIAYINPIFLFLFITVFFSDNIYNKTLVAIAKASINCIVSIWTKLKINKKLTKKYMHLFFVFFAFL